MLNINHLCLFHQGQAEKMNSISEECQKLKEKYDECFNGWFKDTFLRGGTQDTCKPLFQAYQECVKVSIKIIELYQLCTLL